MNFLKKIGFCDGGAFDYVISKAKFEYWQRSEQYLEHFADGDKWSFQHSWYWHLKAPNGKIIAQGEGFNSKQACLSSIASVRRWAKTPRIERVQQ